MTHNTPRSKPGRASRCQRIRGTASPVKPCGAVNRVATIPVAALHLNERNPRTITTDAFLRLRKSIARDPKFMELRPIVTDATGTILGGNQRYRACIANGLTELPAAWVRQAADLTPEERKRFVILDNSPAGISGEWDDDILAADYEIAELDEIGMKIAEGDEELDEHTELCVPIVLTRILVSIEPNKMLEAEPYLTALKLLGEVHVSQNR